ncbi:hypothetical protein LGT41_0001110 [Abyssibius alkaniclasticus]|uniref:hypothetical protein n=1 Tax=Abyssibius alkaniclasticus TaxID=2881234 RepID=UPI002363C133|nr:hypothetical protein [Abyssibius alkaniclasticus]UPH71445.1 hypothetical protein LGT41_0001110 [Abyssibius alkaniclasticus]
MFTIEDEFSVTKITLVDDTDLEDQADVVIEIGAESVVIRQFNIEANLPDEITLTHAQLEDLKAAINLPAGAYTRAK